MAKDKYEISLWEDIFVAASGNVPGHYEEEKIAVIGADDMTSQCRAIEPKITPNVNGKVTFTFKMYYRYHDELTGEDYENPFLKLLVNERKIKVKWLDKWYDLIIKNIQESSNGKTVVYTCEDANINELAKSGFDLIFDDDLSINNTSGGNQGTVQELVSRTIEGTEWSLGDTDIIQQYTEESVFELVLSKSITVTNMQTSSSVTIPAGDKVLIYYSQLADFINSSSSGDKTFTPLYLAYDASQRYDRFARTEMLVQADCCSLASCYCLYSGNYLYLYSNGSIGDIDIRQVSVQYRANRLVSQPISQIEPVTGQSCYVYNATASVSSGPYADKINQGDIIYEHIGSEFNDALYANNLITNGVSFTSTAGWEAPSATPIELTVYPATQPLDGAPRSVFLKLPGNSSGSDKYYYNDAIRANSQYFKDGCKQGEQYRVRIKAYHKLMGSYWACTTSDLKLIPLVQQWKYDNTAGVECKQPKVAIGKIYFSASNPISEGSGWIHFDLTCTNTFSGSDIYKDNIGFFVQSISNNDGDAVYIQEIQFFKIVKDINNTVILPGELNKLGVLSTAYTYFKIEDGEPLYLYKDTTDWNKSGLPLVQKYNDNYSKIRSINIKQSNRFNILQTIAETFECWIRFDVKHDESGKIQYINGVPQKFITIKKEIGEERGIGFVYGIDLQSIQRTLESNQIVTKTIVLENNNEFGENGTCRISRSTFNYPQIDYIFNFDYYINHNLLNGPELNDDLYTRNGTANDTKGYYSCLHNWNSEYIDLAEKNAKYRLAVTKDEGLKTVYETAIEAAGATIQENKQWICNVAATRTYEQAQTYIATYIDDPEVKAHVAAIEAQRQLVNSYESQLEALDLAIGYYNELIDANELTLATLKDNIKSKTDLFQKKYARFISEGSWTDSKYYDDNLYYLDANSVAYTSSRPKVSYNISVMRLTGLEDFKIKDFALGDISYIEDTDFFGYTYITEGNEQVKTPYREKVIITEVTYNLDEPEKDSFKVQNYRTQFEDLFQRITAQTQSLQYTVGAYNKVSDIIKSDSTIKDDVLISSVEANNNALNRSSLNNSVVTDERGITVTNIQNASEAVRVTSGGLFITTNGGDTWNNAIRGDGIGTQFLASGSINTKKIQIIGEDHNNEEAVAFKWDEDGITAYDSFSTIYSPGQAYDKDRYVRFNKEGINLQTTTAQGTAYEKLKLGRLNSDNEYGLRINSYVNGSTQKAFEATDSGLFVRGNIVASSLELDSSIRIDAGQVYVDNSTSVTSTLSSHDMRITANTSGISAEITARQSADTTLSNSITATASNLAVEITARQSADTNLSSRITANASAIELKVSESDVTGNYVVGKINLNSTTATIAASHINLIGAVTADCLTTGAVTAAKISTGAVTADKISAGAVTAAKVSAGAITTDKLAANAVTAAKISAGTITATEIASNAITTAKISSGAITAEKISTGAITAAKISSGAITTEKLSATDLVIGAAHVSGQLTAATLDGAKINGTLIQASQINVSSINIGNLSGNANSKVTSIDGSVITTGTINADRIDASTIQSKIADITGLLSVNGTGININNSGNLAVTGTTTTNNLTVGNGTLIIKGRTSAWVTGAPSDRTVSGIYNWLTSHTFLCG